jgi:hypothetical protein
MKKRRELLNMGLSMRESMEIPDQKLSFKNARKKRRKKRRMTLTTSQLKKSLKD